MDSIEKRWSRLRESLPSLPNAPLRYAGGIALSILLLGCISFRPHSISISRLDDSDVGDIVAGEDVPVKARLFSYEDELTASIPLPAGLSGYRWSIENATMGEPVLSFTGKGVVHANVPGKSRLNAGARGVVGTADVKVVWPVDSIEFRLAAHTVRVGDSVELIHRIHFNTGEVEMSGSLFYAPKDAAGPPHTRERPGKGWSPYPYKLNVVDWFPDPPRERGDTTLLIAKEPGILRVGAVILHRWFEDTLRVEPARGARNTSYRRAPFAPARPRPTAVACYNFQLGTWRVSEGGWDVPADFTNWVPSTIALDTTSLIRWVPGYARRLDAARGPTFTGERYWTVTSRDSGYMYMEAPAEKVRGTSTPSFWVTFRFLPSADIEGEAQIDEEHHASMHGTRIPCNQS